MDGSCTVTFGGSHGGTYFIPCNLVNSFDNELVFYGDSRITISDDINHNGNTLYCQPYCKPAYINNDDLYVYISPENVTWNNRSLWYREYDVLIAFCLISLLVFRVLTIFRR